MSGIKSSSNNSNPSQPFDINQINPQLRAEYEKIMYHVRHQLVFDPDLNHRQRMFLLYQRNAIENEFLRYLHDCVNNLNISNDLRISLFQNLNKLSTNLIPIDMYSRTNQYHFVEDDSDEETYAESLSNIDSADDDTYDDLENILLDETEFEHDHAASHPTAENNEEISTNANDKMNPCN